MVTLRALAKVVPPSAEPAADDRTIHVVASTDGVNRFGYSVDPAGWDLANYLPNPVVLFDHGDGPDGYMPIGRAENVRVEDGQLNATIRFASAAVSPLADRCLAAFREGVLNAVSVGFGPPDPDEIDGDVVRRAELWEISVVAVPADPGALRKQNVSTLSALRGSKARPMKTTKQNALTAKLAKILKLAAEGEPVEPVEGEEKPAALAVSDDAVLAAVETMQAAWDALLAALTPPADGEEAAAEPVAEQAAKALKAAKAARLAASNVDVLASENARLTRLIELTERKSIIAKLRAENRLTAHQAKVWERLPLADLKDLATDTTENPMLSAPDTIEKTADALNGKTWAAMTNMEKHALYNENRALYDQLSAAHKKTSGR